MRITATQDFFRFPHITSTAVHNEKDPVTPRWLRGFMLTSMAYCTASRVSAEMSSPGIYHVWSWERNISHFSELQGSDKNAA